MERVILLNPGLLTFSVKFGFIESSLPRPEILFKTLKDPVKRSVMWLWLTILRGSGSYKVNAESIRYDTHSSQPFDTNYPVSVGGWTRAFRVF